MKLEELVKLNFERLLLKTGMTQKEVAKLYPGKKGGVEPNYISQLFTAEKLTIRAIKKLSRVFHVEESEFFKTSKSDSHEVANLLEQANEILTTGSPGLKMALQANILQFSELLQLHFSKYTWQIFDIASAAILILSVFFVDETRVHN